jgi:hypothetical protein
MEKVAGEARTDLCCSRSTVHPHGQGRGLSRRVEPHGLTAVAPLHTLRRAEPSEAYPPSPRLRRVPTSHSSTGLHPWLSAKEGKIGRSNHSGADRLSKLPCLPTAPPVGRSLFRAIVRPRFVGHLEAAQNRQCLCSALLPLFVLRSKLA